MGDGMNSIEKITSYVFTIMSIIVGISFYDTISENTLLRVCFYSAIVFGIVLLAIDLILTIFTSSGTKRGVRVRKVMSGVHYVYILFFVGCLLFGVYFRIEGNKVEITGKPVLDSEIGNTIDNGYINSIEGIQCLPTETINETEESVSEDSSKLVIDERDFSSFNSADIHDYETDFSTETAQESMNELIPIKETFISSYGDVTLLEGDIYNRIEHEYIFSATISNNSQRSIELKVMDAVSLELLEYIPYDQLYVQTENYGFAGKGDSVIQHPLLYTYDMDIGATLQKAKSVYEDNTFNESNEITDNQSYYVMQPNDIKEIYIYVNLKKKGYYRFKIGINYYVKGEKNSYTFPECECICPIVYE